MSKGTEISGKSGQDLHEQFVAWAANLFMNSGWAIVYNPRTTTPSGVPVRADLRADNPQGQHLVFEFKTGNSEDYLPISAYAQSAQLNRSGGQTVVVTNMKIPAGLANLFRESHIAVVKTPSNVDQMTFLNQLRAALPVHPSLIPAGRK